MAASQFRFSQKFPKKRAFITGAASGLGKALAQALAKEGWTLGLSDIMETELLATVAEAKKLGGRVIHSLLDVADQKAYAKVAENFLEQAGGIDLLINNAGVGDGGEVGDYTLENWDWMVGINQMGVIYGTHLFMPAFKAQAQGHIMNIASAAAFGSMPGMAAYNSSKAAVLAFSETLYAELKPDEIQISVVMPTFFKSKVMQHSRQQKAEAKEIGEKLMTISGLTADQVAIEILHKAAKGKFYIVLPGQARWMWRIKRMAPRTYLKIMAYIHKNKSKAQARLEKKYQKAIKKQKR